MRDLALFSIASQRNQWLAARSAAIASNIANSDTPGYKARDLPSFDAVLNSQSAMVRTSSDHLSPAAAEGRKLDPVPRSGAAGKHSGNSVSLEAELITLGEVRAQHSMVTGAVGAFSRMLQLSVKA